MSFRYSFLVNNKDSPADDNNNDTSSFDASARRRIRRKVGGNSSFGGFGSEPSLRQTRNSEASTVLRSPEKEEKMYPTRGGVVEKPKISDGGMVVGESSKQEHVWPKLYIALTSKEKEEDFMAMKGCKPSHRPKKRAKMIQRTILLVSPGAWLTDMCQERYEVREKKTAKKRPTGLKAMGSMESDSE
ncbi:hypothetical protein CTI12_AA207520 [Artemisia annua]|uniref:Uncharacterized protein n=1 Tax=Artemisia annua TaxID=35608 RepID=A0A2U1P0A7_ARTAN|nr:hypothetical protein CTI12_AA207520 [Artemisia annua]